MKAATLTTKKIALIGLFAALLVGGQLALSGVPNIEVVTLFIILFCYAFGLELSIIAVFIFCLIEAFVFGLNTWVVAYFIYWPLLTFTTSFLNKFGYKKNIAYIFLGVIMTVMFCFITSFFDAAFAYSASGISYFTLFWAIYTRGVFFYVTHIISNAIFLSIAFPVLKPVFIKAKGIYLKQ